MKKSYLLFPLALALLASCTDNSKKSSSVSSSDAKQEDAPTSSQSASSSKTSDATTKSSESASPSSSEIVSSSDMSSGATSKSSGSTAQSSASYADTSSSSSSSGVSGDYLITEPTSITFMSNSSYEDLLNSFIKSFKEIEPNVTVTNTKESTSYDGVKDKVIESLTANNHPDMALLYPDAIGTLNDYSVVVQLDDYIDNADYGWTDDEKDDFIESYLEEGTEYSVPGTYSLPFSKSTEGMFYNKDVIIGLNLSKQDPSINGGMPLDEKYINSLTWDELFDKLCPAIVAYNDTLDNDHKILVDNAEYTKAIFGYDSDDNFFITLAKQYGYGYTELDQTTGEGKLLFNIDDVDSDGDGKNDTNGMKQLMKKFKTAYDNGYLFTKGSSKGGNYTNYSFTARSCLFTIGSTGGLKYQVANDSSINTAIARIPQAPVGEGHVEATISQGPSICILDHKDENRALASWLFYKHMTSEINCVRWAAETGYSPIRYSALEDDQYLDLCDENGKTGGTLDNLKARVASYVAQNDVTDTLYTSPVFKGSDEAREQVGGIVTTLFTADASKNTDAYINELFATAENNIKTKM